MNVIKSILLLALIVITVTTNAQTSGAPQFIQKGKIEFERKTNQHAFMDENSEWSTTLKKSFSKFVTSYFDLSFENGRTVYKAGKEPEVRQSKFWGMLDPDNIIFSNFDSSKSVSQKDIYGDTYLVMDSVRKIDWKIGTEIRKIAGFDCRKAVGKILDSIVVIAFYSDEILTTGGPESFSGLPGMILGVAIPRMHTTWYATKLQLINPVTADMTAPKKGKKYAGPDFKTQINTIMKSEGEWGKRIQWQLLL